MKFLVLLVTLLVIQSSGAIPFGQADGTVSDAVKQQQVLQLLYKMTQPIRTRFETVKEASKNFNPTADMSHYKDGGNAVKHLMKDIEDHKVLEQKHWFSLFKTCHKNEAVLFFDVLNNCKDWNTFISNAAYFREILNEGVFAYGFYAAVTHCTLTHHITLPPLYEITPHMFTNTEVMNKAYTAKMTQTPSKFHMNFTGTRKNPEQRVAYFGEDIGMNVHHVTWHMDYPFWWKDQYGHHLDRKGELFFWAHHQLTARFDAERLSNYLDMVDEIYWDKPIVQGFAPHTAYKYGGEFPMRPDNMHFEDVDGIACIRDMKMMESRIRDAIAHGYITDENGKHINIRNEHGIDLLGDIIESSEYSKNPQYYGSLHNLAHIVLGRQSDPHGKFNMPPGVMEHFETATRDPAFFRLHKYINNIFKEHKDSLPPYTPEDIAFPDISVNKAGIKGNLETYFEDFEFDLTMGVDDTEEVEDIDISAIVSRINHKPFAFELDVDNNAGVAKLATIRIFLCPRRDANGIIFTLNEGRWNCIEMDKFWKKLTPGSNHIEHKSSEVTATIPDMPSFNNLMNMANEAVSSGGNMDHTMMHHSCGIPDRMLLPKGHTDGMEFVLFVAVTDGSKDAAVDGLEDAEYHGVTLCGVHGETYPDKRPLGFPLDRQIKNMRSVEAFPNLYKNIVTITHDPKHHH